MNAIARKMLTFFITRTVIVLLVATLTACSGGGGATSGPDPISPPPPPPPAAPSGPFSGDTAATLGSVIGNFYVADPVVDTEYSVDATGHRIQRTVIKVVFADTATVGDANEVLTDIKAELVSTLAGYPAAVVRIPDPGSLTDLDVLISEIESSLAVHSVLRSEEMITLAVPDSGIPANVYKMIFSAGNPRSAPEWDYIDHQVSVRSAGAWALRGLSAAQPSVVIMDMFGGGNVAPEAYDIEKLPGQPDFGFVDVTQGANPQNANHHGYVMLSIIAARHSEEKETFLEDFASGMLPDVDNNAGLRLGVADLIQGNTLATQSLMMILAGIAADNSDAPIIVNISLGRDCDKFAGPADPCTSRQNLNDTVVDFIRMVRSIDPDEREILFVVAAGNNKNAGPSDAETGSLWNASTLLDGWADRLTQTEVAPLSNVLVVEAAMHSEKRKAPFSPLCTFRESFVGGHVAGMGVGVFGIKEPDAFDSNDDSAGEIDAFVGSSSAAAQVSGLAAYVASIRPDLTAQQLKRLIIRTSEAMTGTGVDCLDLNETAPVIDAYAATLATDPADQLIPEAAAARMLLLDVTGGIQGGDPDGNFDIFDLRKWVEVLTRPEFPDGEFNYGRFDINGDGTTGGTGTARFDLDLSMDFANPTSVPFFVVEYDLLGQSVSYSEDLLNDAEIVCYYANSDLYTITGVEPHTVEQRDTELQKVRSLCDPCLAAQEAAQKLGAFGAKLSAPDPVCELPEMLITATKVYEFEGEIVTSMEIFKVSGDGQTFVQLTQTPDPFGYTYAKHPAWSPNRDKIAFTWFLDIGEHVFVMDADGENKVALTADDPNVRHFHPAWSPDGTKIAYTRSQDVGVFEIYVMNADGTDQQKMYARTGLIAEIAWSPDGKQLAFSAWTDGTSNIVVADVVVEVVGDQEIWSLENPVTVVGGGINLTPEWSPDGQKILYLHTDDLLSDRNLFVIDTTTLEIEQLTGGEAEFVREYDADWSPDGTQIAMMRSGEVWVINADGSDLEQLTPTDANLIVEEVDW